MYIRGSFEFFHEGGNLPLWIIAFGPRELFESVVAQFGLDVVHVYP